MWTPRSVRCTALRRKVPPTGTRVLGYHPLLATRADTGEVLHARLRTARANTARGIVRFVDELLARLTRAGGDRATVLRADSGFYQHKLLTGSPVPGSGSRSRSTFGLRSGLRSTRSTSGHGSRSRIPTAKPTSPSASTGADA
ncbi:MAG: transposase [Acidimicrobiia bacterium]